MKLLRLLVFVLFLVSLVLVSWEFQGQEEDALLNVSNNASSRSFELLGNETPLEGEFRPILSYPAWDFQGFKDRIFVYYDGAVKAYDLKTGKLLFNITPVYNYYFSNRYAYLKTNNGSFILDYKTLRLMSLSMDENIEYAFKFGDCVIIVKDRNALINSQVFGFNSTPKIVFFDNGFVVYGHYNRKTRAVFFDKKCNILNDTTILNYPLDYKVVNDKIFFIRYGLFLVNQSKFPDLEGERVLHEYLSMSSVYLFNSEGQKIASLGMGGAIGFYNNTLYSFMVRPGYCDELIKFYLPNKSLEEKCFSISHYSGWFVSQGTFGDFGEGFMAFAYWGFSGESGTSHNYICVYIYDKRLKCTAYYSGTRRVNPVDEIKAWDRYFAVVPREESRVVIYEVR